MITMMPDGDLDDLDAVADNEEDKDSTPEDDAWPTNHLFANDDHHKGGDQHA